MNKSRTFKLLQNYPGHEPGELLYETEFGYYFEKPPYFYLEKSLVENYNDYFEEVILNWEKGEEIYFINLANEIVKDEFHPVKHSTICHRGNAFKTHDEAEYYKEKIDTVLNDSEIIFMEKDTLLEIFQNIQSNYIEKAKQIIQSYIN